MVAGTKNKGLELHIGTTAADPGTDTFTQVKRMSSVGGFGSDAPILDATAFEDSAREKLKGIRDSGDLEVGGRRVVADAGQNALSAAADSDSDSAYNFFLLLPGVGAGGTDAKWSFKAIVPKFMTEPGEIDGLLEFTSTLAISGPITYAEI